MRREAMLGLAAVGLAAVALAGQRAPSDYRWDLPPGVPPPRLPVGAPMTEARVELGRHLFYDTRLSGNGEQSCATCHIQALAFTDGRARGLGSTGERHPRSAMSLVNVAYRDALTWANPTLRSLEEQVLVPLFGTDPVELGLSGHEPRVYAALAASPVYRRLFVAAFPPPAPADGVERLVTTDNVALALAAFQRSIVSFRSPYDRYRFHDDETALSPAARRGMRLFFSGRARCGGCHLGHTVSTDLGLNLDGGSKAATSPLGDPPVFLFHNTGLYNLPGRMPYPADNTGKYAHTGKLEDAGRFRIPTLRNVAVTAPYMHNGIFANLRTAVAFYNKFNTTAPSAQINPETGEPWGPTEFEATISLEELTHGPALEEKRIDALVAVLKTLTDARYEHLLED